MHRLDLTEMIVLEKGRAVRISTAHYKDKSLDVFRETDGGKFMTRNVYNLGPYGYYVYFPGDKDRYITAHRPEAWGEPSCVKYFVRKGFPLTDADIRAATANDPEFIYTVRKAPQDRLGTGNVLSLLRVWREHPEAETLAALGLWSLIWSKAFWSLPEKSKKDFRKFLSAHPGRDWTFREVSRAVKHGLTEPEIDSWESTERQFFKGKSVSYKTFFYAQKNIKDARSADLYRDLIGALKAYFPERLKDDYWTFPKSIKRAHDKAMREARNILEIREAERNLAAKAKLAEKKKLYSSAVSKAAGLLTKYNGLSVYVPEDIGDIVKQADALHQCLVSMDYAGRVIDGGIILVFVRHGSKPLATAEIRRDGSVGQFYGNELRGAGNRSCLPTDAARRALEKFLNEFDAKKLFAKKSRKAMRRAA